MHFNAQDVYDSYRAIIAGLSESEREQLFELSRISMPRLAEYLVEQFRLAEDVDPILENKIIGATFMFLAFVNAITEEPLALPDSTRQDSTFPSFGTLPKLK